MLLLSKRLALCGCVVLTQGVNVFIILSCIWDSDNNNHHQQQLVLTFLSPARTTCTQTLLVLLVYLTIQISANLIGHIIVRTSCCGNYPQSEALISHLYKTFFTLATKKKKKKMKVASMCLWLFLPLWSQLGSGRRFTDCRSSHNRFSDHRLLLFFFSTFFFS